MSTLTLRREVESPNNPTMGKYFVGNKEICHSLELPWLNNQRQVSCIPKGRYRLRFLPNGSPSFKYPCFLIEGVPGRTGIMIHRANFARQLRGCQAPGMRRQNFDVLESTRALNLLVEEHQKNSFTHIEIV